MVVFDVLTICCWRKWPGMFGVTAALVVRCRCSWWWESYLARRARSQLSTKGLRHVAKLSEAEVIVDCIAEDENPFTCADRRWSLAKIKRVRGGVREGVEVGL